MDEFIRITPRPQGFSFRQLWKSRDLIWLLARKRVLLGYKQTVLGPLWILLQPVLTALVYGLLFGTLAGFGTDGVARLPFYLSGTAVWGFFSGCVTGNALCFRENANLFGKVWFPRLAVPAANLLASGFTLLIQLGLTVVISGSFSGKLLLLPLAAMQLGLLGMGVGLTISALTVRYRDLHVLVTFGLQLWMYASPIVYPASQTTGWAASWLRLNPVTAPVELIRWCLFALPFPEGSSLVWSFALTAGFLALGIRLFSGAEATFLDTV